VNFSILGIRDSPECGGDGLLAGYGWGYGWSWWWEGWVEALVRVMRFGGTCGASGACPGSGASRHFQPFCVIPRPSLL